MQAMPDDERAVSSRTIDGAKFYIQYPKAGFKKGKLGSSGTVPLADGTEVDWYLWDGDRPQVGSYAALAGYISALYKNELYDTSTHHSTYRSFGISESSIRSRLWLIVRPPHADDEGKRSGVYPRGDRNGLLLRGGPHAGSPLPINEWAAEFADNMPDELLAAIKKARAGADGTLSDVAWRERLMERFGSRWRKTKLRSRKGGLLRLRPSQPGADSVPRRAVRVERPKPSGGEGGSAGGLNTGSERGAVAVVRRDVGSGIPHYRAVTAEDLPSGMLAAWQPHDPQHPEGVVLLNVEHAVMAEQIEHWQSQYPDQYADDIQEDVIRTYGEIAVAKVAHSEHLKGLLPAKVVDDELRSEAALTLGLLGLISEEAVLSTRIGGKYAKKRRPAVI
jgi:hypothetical protein